MNTNQVPKRILGTLMQSLSAGVVPRQGAPYIAIGRADEITAFLEDLKTLPEGRGGMRFLVGRYGSGKSFLLQLIRGYAIERNYLCADGDLSPERRLYGGNKGGLATYRELLKNLSSKACPDGGALPKILSRWASEQSDGGTDAKYFYKKLKPLEDMVGGFDFCRVLSAYCEAVCNDDTEMESRCLCWFRGEYNTKGEAKQALGMVLSDIINDENWFDYLKIWASASQIFGYGGLVVFIDECVNLYKIVNRVSRENNYEKILSMFNDTMQGRAPGLELVLAGTPQFLEDTHRGLFSYEALRSRLCDSRYSADNYRNLLSPVIRLKRLSEDELLALLVRITALHEEYYQWKSPLGQTEMETFLSLCLANVGASDLLTPREMLRDYLSVLNILQQNPTVTFEDVVKDHAPMQKEKEEASSALFSLGDLQID